MSKKRQYPLVGDGEAAACRGDAELALVAAQLACLHRRHAAAPDGGALRDVTHQIRDALLARQTLLLARTAA